MPLFVNNRGLRKVTSENVNNSGLRKWPEEMASENAISAPKLSNVNIKVS